MHLSLHTTVMNLTTQHITVPPLIRSADLLTTVPLGRSKKSPFDRAGSGLETTGMIDVDLTSTKLGMVVRFNNGKISGFASFLSCCPKHSRRDISR